MNDSQDSIPPLAMLMGCGGLVPFFLCAGAAHSGVALWSGIALVICGIYGAVILSFIGAVHWGLALHGDRSPLWFVWSVVPALYAWQPVVFLDTRMALLALVPGLQIQMLDRHRCLLRCCCHTHTGASYLSYSRRSQFKRSPMSQCMT